jgi:hypothetical protein
LAEGEARHGMCSVFSDSWKLLHLLDRSREASAVPIYDSPCGGAKISRASVIAEALPRAEYVIFGSASQRSEIGKSTQPLTVIRNHCGDLSLLEHELGDEGGVRIAGAAPRQVTAVAAIPAEKGALERANICGRCHGLKANVQRPTLNVQFSIQKIIEH